MRNHGLTKQSTSGERTEDASESRLRGLLSSAHEVFFSHSVVKRRVVLAATSREGYHPLLLRGPALSVVVLTGVIGVLNAK